MRPEALDHAARVRVAFVLIYRVTVSGSASTATALTATAPVVTVDDADDSTSSGVSGIGAQSLAETDTANHLECPAAATAEVNSYTRSYTPNGAGNLTSTDLAYDDNGFTIVIP